MTRSIFSRLRSPLCKLGVLAFWILIWGIAARAIGLELILPSPGRVFVRLAALARTGAFWGSVFGTLLRIFAGYALGCVCGVLLAALMHFVRPAAPVFSPLLTVVRATPVASFIVLILVWMQDGRIPVLIAFLMVLPIVCEAVRTGLASADPGLREVGKVFALRRGFLLRQLYLPAAAPHFAAAARTSFGLAWKAGVAAEVLCAAYVPASVGAKIYDAKVYLETADLFAWTVVVILCSLLIGLLPRGAAMLRQLRERGNRNAADRI